MKKIIASIFVLSLAACGQSAQKPAASMQSVAAPAIETQDARIRLAPNGMDMTAAYLTIKNNGDKPLELIGASADIADHVELHTHEKTTDGMMSMKQVEKFDIPAKGAFELAPMGAHLMVFGVKPALKEGDEAHFTLKFKDAPDLNVTAKFVTNPNMEMKMDEKGGHSH